MMENIKVSLLESKNVLEPFLSNRQALLNVEAASAALIATLEHKGKIYSCGNGGSMCGAMHFAEELTGRYRKSRAGLGAIAISDPSHIRCVANDFGYDSVFSRYVENHGRLGNCLVALSTSGKSAWYNSYRPDRTFWFALGSPGRRMHLRAGRRVCRSGAGIAHQGAAYLDRDRGAPVFS